MTKSTSRIAGSGYVQTLGSLLLFIALACVPGQAHEPENEDLKMEQYPEPASTFSVTRTGEREATIRRQFTASASEVFAAMTKPARIRKWLGAAGRELTVCEVDLREGGSYRYVFAAADGSTFEMYGSYREVVQGVQIVNTESYGGYDWEPLVVTTRFEEYAGRTNVTVTVLYPSAEICDRDIGNLEHSAPVYERLDELLAGEQGDADSGSASGSDGA